MLLAIELVVAIVACNVVVALFVLQHGIDSTMMPVWLVVCMSTKVVLGRVGLVLVALVNNVDC